MHEIVESFEIGRSNYLLHGDMCAVLDKFQSNNSQLKKNETFLLKKIVKLCLKVIYNYCVKNTLDIYTLLIIYYL